MSLKAESVSIKYATAIFNVALDMKLTDQVYDLLKSVQDAIKENLNLYKVMINPEVENEKKINILIKLLKDDKDSTELVLRFLEMLVNKGRIGIFPNILNSYDKLNKRVKGILDVIVYTPFKLDDTNKEKIKNKLSNFLEDIQTVNIEEKIEKSLIGGIMLEMGGRIYDGSISGQIKSMRNSLRGA